MLIKVPRLDVMERTREVDGAIEVVPSGLPTMATFVATLLQHPVFVRTRANAKAIPGIKAAFANVKDGIVKLAAEPDYACLREAADTPMHDEPEGNGVKPGVPGYLYSAAGMQLLMPYVDAIMDATIESAEVAKPEAKAEAPAAAANGKPTAPSSAAELPAAPPT